MASRRASPSPLLAVLLVASCVPSPPPAERPPRMGLRVESVRAGEAAERAGLQPGDILGGWSAHPEARPRVWQAVDSPAALRLLEVEAFGAVALGVWRQDARRVVTLPPIPWGIRARPALLRPQEVRYSDGKRLIAGGRLDQGLRLWREAASRADAATAAWLLVRGAAELAHAGRPEEGRELFERALALAGGEAAPAAVHVWLWESWGDALRLTGRPAEALDAYSTAIRRTDGWPLWKAALFVRLGTAEQARGIASAEASWRSALALYRDHAPGGFGEAETLLLLARVAGATGREEEAAQLRAASLEAARRLDPRGLLVADCLEEEGLAADRRGDLPRAERLYREALALYPPLDERPQTAGTLHMNLAVVAWRQGHLDAAEREVRAALRIFESYSPRSVHVAWALLNLGNLAHDRGEWERAEGYYRRSLRLRQELTPGTADHANSLVNLGVLAKDRGDPAAARSYYRQALAIAERTGDPFLPAYLLGNLGELEAEAGNLDAAEPLLDRCHRLLAAVAPGSLDEASALFNLGELAARRGRLAEGEALHRRALALRHGQAPGTVDEALSHHALGGILRRRGRLAEAAESLRRAVDALEAQGLRLGGSAESGTRFAALHGDLYKDLIDLLLALGREEEAFDVHERYRVRGLATLLSSRPLEAEDVLPSRPLRLAEVARSLDPGTLLLAYSAGPRETVLFSLDAGQGLRVDRLPAGAEDLQRRIESLRYLLQSPGAGARSRNALAARSRDLYRTLLGPVEARLAASRRLLVLPDGPLHALPFAVLASGGEPGGVRWLALRQPVHLAASATLYAGGQARRRQVPRPRLVAFGDPDYRQAKGPAATRSAPPLAPLPATRREVTAVAGLFAGTVYLGEEATETRAREVGRSADYLHFACHGFADDRVPLDSYLALAPDQPEENKVGGEDGVLQAWEIFEEMRLGADLVTLSACETGVSGGELGGEGLTGLTRAFQYAGARTVVASLWGVPDASTTVFMTRFYHHLRAGLPKDEALAAAQADLIRGAARLPPPSAAPWATLGRWLASFRGKQPVRAAPPREPDLSHPYYWAAFQVSGDWR